MTAGKQVDLFDIEASASFALSRSAAIVGQRGDWPAVSRTTDPPTSHQGERDLNRSGRRLSQADQILERLREGHATNAELAEISLKYTSRISDLRARGIDVRVIRQDRSTGLTVYGLKVTP